MKAWSGEVIYSFETRIGITETIKKRYKSEELETVSFCLWTTS